MMRRRFSNSLRENDLLPDGGKICLPENHATSQFLCGEVSSLSPQGKKQILPATGTCLAADKNSQKNNGAFDDILHIGRNIH